MSNRAEEAALKAYPVHSVLIQPASRGGYYADAHLREGFIQGYEQAEKDTIERVVEWLKVHAEDYIVNMTGSYPDAPFNAIIGGECWDELKKAMEKNNG